MFGVSKMETKGYVFYYGMKQQKRQFRKYEDSLRERLADPEYARIFLDIAIEEYEQDGDTKAFSLALRDAHRSLFDTP